jgi:hypothetical protein
MSQFYVNTAGVPGGAVNTLSDDAGTLVFPSASDNIQLVGHVNEQGGTKFSTVTAGTNAENINPMSSFRWIVDPLGFNGTHTTIQAATNAATSGDTIGILASATAYTEDLTLKPGVHYVGLVNSFASNVTIVGNATLSAAGSVGFSGITLQTNGNYFLTISGSGVSVIDFTECNFQCTNFTGINFSNSNSSSFIYFNGCAGAITGVTAALYAMSSPGKILFLDTYINNAANSITSNDSAGQVFVYNSLFAAPLSTTGTGTISAYNSQFPEILNEVAITTAGTGTSFIENCFISSGTSSAISVGAGTTLNLFTCTINSSNTNAITGAGTLAYGGNAFMGSNGINVTTTAPIALTVPQGGTGLTSPGTAGNALISTGTAWISAPVGTVTYTLTPVNAAASPYTVLTTDSYIQVDSTAGPVTIRLPNTTTSGRGIIVKDSAGTAATNNITVTTVGGANLIDGLTSQVMNQNYQSWLLVYSTTSTHYEIN